MILSEAISLVRIALDEISVRFHTDAEITTYVNQCIKDIARRTEMYQVKATIAVVANTQEYVLPTDLLRLTRIDYKPTSDSRVYALDFRDLNNMDEVWWTRQTSAKGRPSYFTLWGTPPGLAAILWPTPQETGTLTVWYYKTPALVSTLGATISLPVGWDDALVDFAEYKALRRARDSRWGEAKQEYEQKIADLITMTRRYTDQSGTIVSAGGNQGYEPWM